LGKVEMLKAEMKTALQKPGVGKIGKSSDRFNCLQANLS
jgi:molecular chaperone GrpE (heat shock protein)